MIELEKDGGIARIFLNRPQKVNALDSGMLAALATLIEGLQEEKSLRVVVLAGRGKAFCGGADVRELASLDQASAPAFVAKVHRVCGAIRALPVPVVARLHGAVIGAGLGVAADCALDIPDAASIHASLERCAEAYAGGVPPALRRHTISRA